MRRYVDHYAGSRCQLWRTPPELFARLHERFRFTMDGAAVDDALLPRFSSPDAPLPWDGERVFCNPPWSDIRPFVDLAGKATFACLLVPARTNARWFHAALDAGARVEFFKPKPKFVGAPHVSPIDCVLLLFGTRDDEKRCEVVVRREG